MAKPKGGKGPQKRLVKMGVTLTERTEYRLRNFAARQRLRPSMVIEQVLADRFRGEDLPGAPPSAQQGSTPLPEGE